MNMTKQDLKKLIMYTTDLLKMHKQVGTKWSIDMYTKELTRLMNEWKRLYVPKP